MNAFPEFLWNGKQLHTLSTQVLVMVVKTLIMALGDHKPSLAKIETSLSTREREVA